MIPTQKQFLDAIQARKLDLTASQAQRAAHFAEILHRENADQNLTRITGVEEFIDGHLIDVIELFKLNTLGKKVLDIGSGSGVPGLLAAAIDTDDSRHWFLTDSERSKAEYLDRSAQELGLKRVSIYPNRVKEVLAHAKPDTVMARAVGTVEKLAGWISTCSTWNNLILFKSRGWDEEWKTSQASRFGKKLTVSQTHEYSSADKYRVLINLKRK